MSVQTEIKPGQVAYEGGVAKNGKRYVEAVAGSIVAGAEVVQCAAANTRRGGVVIPESYTVIGRIESEGDSFIASTREGQILAGTAAEDAADIRHTRYYF